MKGSALRNKKLADIERSAAQVRAELDIHMDIAAQLEAVLLDPALPEPLAKRNYERLRARAERIRVLEATLNYLRWRWKAVNRGEQ